MSNISQHSVDSQSLLLNAQTKLDAAKAQVTLDMLHNLEAAFQMAVMLEDSVMTSDHRIAVRDLINMTGGYNSDDGRHQAFDALREAAGHSNTHPC